MTPEGKGQKEEACLFARTAITKKHGPREQLGSGPWAEDMEVPMTKHVSEICFNLGSAFSLAMHAAPPSLSFLIC